MKIFVLLYNYQIIENNRRESLMRLFHYVDVSLEKAMDRAEAEVRGEPNYIQHSCRLHLRAIESLPSFLAQFKKAIKLPELVENTKEREKLRKIAKILE